MFPCLLLSSLEQLCRFGLSALGQPDLSPSLLEVAVRIDGDVLADVAFQGRGCSIATASASLLTLVVTGTSVREARATADAVDAMLTGDAGAALPDALAPLRSVAPFAARHGCVRMAWQALRDALA